MLPTASAEPTPAPAPPPPPPEPPQQRLQPKEWTRIGADLNSARVAPAFSSQADLDSFISSFKSIWNPTYRDLPPVPSDGGPLAVGVHISLVKFESLDEVAGSFKLVADLMLCWDDQRLAFNSHEVFHNTWSHMGDKLTITPEMIWTPDIVVLNQVSDLDHRFATDESPLVLSDDVFRKETGVNVMWTRRINVNSRCEIDMSSFPFDEQKCSIQLGSWASSRRQMRLVPQDNEKNQLDEMGGVHTSEFRVMNISVHQNDVYGRKAAEKFEELQYDLVLRRYPHFYIVNFMLPMVAVTMLTIATMWMNGPKAGPGVRMNSGTRLVLCVVQIMNITAGWRPASNSDIWLDRFQSHCFTLSMGSVMQSLVMDYLQEGKVFAVPVAKRWGITNYLVDTLTRTTICFPGIYCFLSDMFELVQVDDARGLYAAFHAHSSKLLVGFVYLIFSCLGVSSIISTMWLVLPTYYWERMACCGRTQPNVPGASPASPHSDRRNPDRNLDDTDDT